MPRRFCHETMITCPTPTLSAGGVPFVAVNMESPEEIDLKPLQSKNEPVSTAGGEREERAESRVRKCFDIAVLCIVIVILCGLLSLPAVFSFVDLSEDIEDVTMINTSNRTGETNTSICIPEVYTGSVCRTELQTLQTCLFGDGDSQIFIPADCNQEEAEQTAQTTINGLPFLNPKAECSEIAPSFLCLSLFGLCNNQNRELYRPSSQECRTVTENICAEEFVAAIDFIGSDQLPQCEEFPDVSVIQVCTVNTTDIGTFEPIVCSDGFYLDGTCKPECGVWEAFSYGTYIPIDVTAIVAASIYFISAVVLLIFSCIRYKSVLKFPSIFIVYGTATVGVLELFTVMGYVDRRALFCTSRELVQSIRNATTFCKLQAFVFIYCFPLLAMFISFHILSVFWAVAFPFHARSFKAKGHLKYVHLTMLLLALILPWGTVTVSLEDGVYRRFPPITCYPGSNKVILYGITWPVCVMLAINLSFIAIVFWILIRILQKKRRGQGRKSYKALLKSYLLMSTAELKILITFIYYMIALGSVLALSSVGTVGPKFTTELLRYFSCEATGIMPGKVCERRYQRLEIEVPVTLGLVVLGLYPAVNLVYILNLTKIKRWILKQCTHNTTL